MENEGSGSTHSGASNEHYDSSAAHHVVLIAGHNKWEWVFLAFCIPGVLLLAACSFVSMKTCHVEFSVKDTTMNLELVICMAACISLLFALYGVFGEHQYEIYMHTVLLALSLYCSWIAFCIDLQCLYDVKLIINIIVCVLCIGGFLFAFKAIHAPDWVEFRIIGVSDVLTAMYNQVCYFLALLKADTAFMVLFALYSAEVTYSFCTKMWWAYQIEIFVYAVFSWLCGRLCIYKEDKNLIRAFFLLNIVYPVLIIYQLTRMFSVEPDDIFLYSAIVLGFIAVLSKIYLLVQLYKSSQKFGYGLNTSSFRELVSRNSSNLLSRERSALLF